jgi:hypothetical protein
VGSNSEALRISGIARRVEGWVEGALLERVILSSNGGELGRLERVAPFAIELDNGDIVRVELAPEPLLEPIDVKRCLWSEVEHDPTLAALRGRGPGPHVEVEIRRARLDEGSRVEVLASDAEHAFDEGADHRSAPTKRLTHVTVRAVAIGDDAKAVLDRLLAPAPDGKKRRPSKEKKPRGRAPPHRLVGRVLGAVAVLLLVAAANLPLSPITVDLVALACGVLAAIAVASAVDTGPRFIEGEKAVEGPRRYGGIMLLTIVPVGLGFLPAIFEDYGTLWGTVVDSSARINASSGSCVTLALWGCVLAGIAFTSCHRGHRLLRLLLSAPRLPRSGRLDGTWGSFEGRVRDPSPVTFYGEAMAIVHVIDETITSGSDPNICVERVLSKGTFFLDGPDDQSFEVTPKNACWTSSVRIDDRRASPDDDRKLQHTQAVPLGGSILVAGRAFRKKDASRGTFAATGPEALVFVAVREGKSARLAVWVMVVARVLAIAVAMGAVAVGVRLIVDVEPRLPAFNTSGGD